MLQVNTLQLAFMASADSVPSRCAACCSLTSKFQTSVPGKLLKLTHGVQQAGDSSCWEYKQQSRSLFSKWKTNSGVHGLP